MGSALISLTFDDGLRCQFEQAVPILDRYDFSATFFLIANQEANHESWWGHIGDWWKIDWREEDVAMLEKLVQNGHEIGSHSVTHNLDKMDKHPNTEVHESKRFIEGKVRTNVSSFCYPYYRSHAYLADMVKNAGYTQARGGGTLSTNYVPQNSYYSIPHDDSLDLFNVDCRQMSTHIKEDVNGWIQSGHWHVLTFHGIGEQQNGWQHIPVAEFDRQMAELAKLRDSGAVEVATFKDGSDRFRQP
jgi:peptidoglycan/xylan/chitin deacetylase (PgdA/CDA1 family)